MYGLSLVAVTVLSYGTVGYLTGDWSLAGYTFLAVGIFSSVLFFYTMRGRISFSTGKKINTKITEQDRAIAKSIEEKYAKAKELEKLQARVSGLISGEIAPAVVAIKNLVSLLHEGAFGKLPPAAQESLRQVYDHITNLTRSLETYANENSAKTAKKPEPAQSIRSLKILSSSEKNSD